MAANRAPAVPRNGNDWWPNSGHQVADAPLFERYGESFDSRTGAGGLEVWIPLA